MDFYEDFKSFHDCSGLEDVNCVWLPSRKRMKNGDNPVQKLEPVAMVTSWRNPNIGSLLVGFYRDKRILIGNVCSVPIFNYVQRPIENIDFSAIHFAKTRMQTLYEVALQVGHIMNPIQNALRHMVETSQEKSLLFHLIKAFKSENHVAVENISYTKINVPDVIQMGFPIQAYKDIKNEKSKILSIENKVHESEQTYYDSRLLPNIDNIDKVLLPLVGIDRRIKYMKAMPTFFVNPLIVPLQDMQYQAFMPIRPITMQHSLKTPRLAANGDNLVKYFCQDIMANMRNQLNLERDEARKKRCRLNAYKEKSGRITTLSREFKFRVVHNKFLDKQQKPQMKPAKDLIVSESNVWSVEELRKNLQDAYPEPHTELTISFFKNVHRVLQMNNECDKQATY